MTTAISLVVAVMQGGCTWYAQSMLSWYFKMASKNMHAVEQSISGNVYNKAEYWGLLGGKNHGSCISKDAPIPDPRCCEVLDRIYLYTKPSDIDNFRSMLNGGDFVRPLIPWPYNFMKRVKTFESKKSEISSSLWMVQDPQSYKYLAKLEWDAE